MGAQYCALSPIAKMTLSGRRQRAAAAPSCASAQLAQTKRGIGHDALSLPSPTSRRTHGVRHFVRCLQRQIFPPVDARESALWSRRGARERRIMIYWQTVLTVRSRCRLMSLRTLQREPSPVEASCESQGLLSLRRLDACNIRHPTLSYTWRVDCCPDDLGELKIRRHHGAAFGATWDFARDTARSLDRLHNEHECHPTHCPSVC